MPLLLALALFVPLALAVADAAQKKFCEALPMVFLGLSLVLYVLGLFSCLVSAVWLLCFLWGGCLLYLAIALVREVRRKKWPMPSVGLCAFVLLAMALWWMCRGSRYAIWDEFSHWGRAAKAVYAQNVLPAVAAGEDLFRDYPPGVALVQALVLQAGRMEFREDVVIFVQGLFSGALLLYPLKGYTWKKAPAALGAMLLLLLAPATVFWNYYTGTMVDGLLGVLFAFVLLVHFLGGDGVFERVLQCLACAMLPLLKSAGMLWAVLACAVIFADRWRGQKGRGRRAKPAGPARKGNPLAAMMKWGGWLLPLWCALASWGSWSLYLWLKNVPRRWSAEGIGLAALWQLVTGSAPAWRYETIRGYLAAIFTEQNYGWPVGFLPYMGFFAVFAGLYFLLRHLTPARQRKRYATAFWGLWAAGLVYVVLLLGNYLFLFSEYEAVRLSSLSRYLNTYAAAMMVFLAGWLAAVLPLQKWLGQLASVAAGAGVWLLLSNPGQVLGTFFATPAHAVSTAAAQQPYSDAADEIRWAMKDEVTPVYVVSMDDLGETGLRLGYELAPQILPQHTASIGPGYAEDDILSLRITAGEWAQLLQDEGYEFVYLFRPNEAFVAEFGPLFENTADIAEGGLYRVLPREDGVALELADKSLGDACYTGTCN